MGSVIGVSKETSEYERALERLEDDVVSSGGHFVLRYAQRNCRSRRGTGTLGVQHPELLERYASALERSYEHFVTTGWDAPKSQAEIGPRRRSGIPVNIIHLGVFGTDPATVTNSELYSTVNLRSLIPEPDLTRMLQRAQVEAAHEAAHLFTHRHHPPDPNTEAWRWLDEAIAVHTELQLYPEASEALNYGAYWVYRPELALNATLKDGGGYCAAWFVEFLTRNPKFDPNLIRDTWQMTPAPPGPIAGLDLLLQQRHQCTFADVFEEYIIETFLYRALAPNLHERFGERSLAEWFELKPGEESLLKEEDRLAPFACRYYRFDFPADVKQLDLRVESGIAPADSRLRAWLLLVCSSTGQSCCQVKLQQQARASGGVQLRETINCPSLADSYAVLVVANVPEPLDNLVLDLTAVQDYQLTAQI